MGNYTAVATRIKVSKSATKELLDFLDYLYDISGTTKQTLTTSAVIQKAIDVASLMLSASSEYFETWEWSVKEDHETHWLYESRASTTRADARVLIALLDGMKNVMVVEDGDIVARLIGESSVCEQIVCFENGQFVITEGYRSYRHEYGFISDYRHPKNFKRDPRTKEKIANGELSHDSRRHYDDFIPPWNKKELEILLEKEARERKRDSRNNFGHF